MERWLQIIKEFRCRWFCQDFRIIANAARLIPSLDSMTVSYKYGRRELSESQQVGIMKRRKHENKINNDGFFWFCRLDVMAVLEIVRHFSSHTRKRWMEQTKMKNSEDKKVIKPRHSKVIQMATWQPILHFSQKIKITQRLF